MSIPIDKQIFNQNLLLTQAYCELQLNNPDANTASVLRSFNPEYKDKPLFSYNYSSYFETVWGINETAEIYDLYDELYEKQLDHKRQSITDLDESKVYKGKILAVRIDDTITDGASEVESEGFIDIYDCPPVDTWFYKINKKDNRTLFAWVPERFIALTDDAIAVNCMDLMQYYDPNAIEHKEYKEHRVLNNHHAPRSSFTYRVKKWLGLK